MLSEEPIPETMEAETILNECVSGDYVLASDDRQQESLTEEQMGVALTAAGSDPAFFRIGVEE